MKKDKPFTVKLKAAVDKRFHESGLERAVFYGVPKDKTYIELWEKFINSFNELTIEQLYQPTPNERLVDVENMIEMIIVSHCAGATDRIADGVLYKEAAKKIASSVEQIQSNEIDFGEYLAANYILQFRPGVDGSWWFNAGKLYKTKEVYELFKKQHSAA